VTLCVRRDAPQAYPQRRTRAAGALIPQPTPQRAKEIAAAITADCLARGHALVCREVEVVNKAGTP